ncbi:MAG: DUF6498-containing protein [Alphaproteobacteria bacterium]
MLGPDFFHRHVFLSALLVILGNIIPLYGVLFWNWELLDIFYIYWFENVLIGVTVVVRMALVAAAWGLAMVIGTIFRIAFFCFHYGLFCFGHGMIMFDIFYEGPIDINQNADFLLGYLWESKEGLLYALFGLVAVVFIKAAHDFFQDRRDARLPETIMFSPYGRIIVLHLTILLGGFAAQELGSPLWALVFLIIFKSGYDFVMVQDFKFIKENTDKNA